VIDGGIDVWSPPPEALARLPVDAQRGHHAAGGAGFLQQSDGAIVADEGGPGGIVATVFEPLEELTGLMPQGGDL